MIRACLTAHLMAAIATPGAAAQVCVENVSGAPQLFTIEPGQGARMQATLLDDESLCAATGGETGGTVWVFAGPQSLEGCSRLVGPDGRDRLIVFAEFDRCRWAFHEN